MNDRINEGKEYKGHILNINDTAEKTNRKQIPGNMLILFAIYIEKIIFANYKTILPSHLAYR